MAIPNFFADIDALNHLLGMEFEENAPELDLTLDLIDLPYWFSLHSDEATQTMKVYTQMDLYNKNEGMCSEKGSLVLDRASGEGQVKAPRDIANNMGAFFAACRNLGAWAVTNVPQDAWAELDPEQAGILLSLFGDSLQWRVVTGTERPELTVQTLFGGVTQGRPYMEDFWERSARDEMDEDELISAAEDGDEDAMETLSSAYLNGDEDREIEQDFDKAFEWMQRWAETGNAVAMFNVGLFCAKGCGVERDFEQAAAWMDRAAAAGDEDAPQAAEKYRKMGGIAARADAGEPEAMAELAGELMAMGGSLEQAGAGKDYAESLLLAQKAVDAGCAAGYWPLALAYEHGRGVAQDTERAIELYRKGTEGGNAPCQHSYGCYLMRGDVLEQDPEQAFELFEKSAAQGYALAYRSLGHMYETGEYIEPDLEEELENYEKACQADASDADFLRHVGFQFMNLMDEEDPETWRRGVERAAHWLRAAADRGDPVAAGSAGEFERILELYEQGVIPAGTSFGDCLGYLSGGSGDDDEQEPEADEDDNEPMPDYEFDLTNTKRGERKERSDRIRVGDAVTFSLNAETDRIDANTRLGDVGDLSTDSWLSKLVEAGIPYAAEIIHVVSYSQLDNKRKNPTVTVRLHIDATRGEIRKAFRWAFIPEGIYGDGSFGGFYF